MEKLQVSSMGVGAHAGPRRSSLFEIPSMAQLRASHCGSSMLSFGADHHDEDVPRQKKVQYENTYRMDPPEKFVPDKVNRIIEEVLTERLENKTYDPIGCSSLCKALAQDIKTRAKELDFKRYKLVSTVILGEKKDCSIRHGSRCVWDADRDSFASAVFENSHLYAVGVLYAVYYE